MTAPSIAIDRSHDVYARFPDVRVVRGTLVVRTGAARDLLPVTNELFFHVLADLGHGIHLPEPLSRYRVHEESMTDRRIPGVCADYMASVCGDVAVRLDQLCEHPPTWASADQLTALVAQYRDLATEHRDAADRQRERGALDARPQRQTGCHDLSDHHPPSGCDGARHCGRSAPDDHI